jgi:hypothetical protein
MEAYAQALLVFHEFVRYGKVPARRKEPKQEPADSIAPDASLPL